MKCFKKWLCAALCAAGMCALLCGCAGGGKTLEAVQKAGVLVVATSPDFPPFEYLENGQPVGIEIDILELIAQRMGVELQVEQMDFESVIPGIQAGKFDVGASGITANEKRKKNVDFSIPYFMASQAIVVTPGSSITCRADLEGKTVSVQTGTTAEEFCMSAGYEVLAFTANNDAAEALNSGKSDAWVVDNSVAAAMAPGQNLVVLEEAMTAEPYAFAFAKGSDDLIGAFDQILAELLEDGTLEEIFNTYATPFVSPGSNPPDSSGQGAG